MKKLFFTIALILFASCAFAQEEIEYKEYSYSQFFQMIEDEKDSIFKLSDSKIIFNKDTDEGFFPSGYDSLTFKPTGGPETPFIINKEIVLSNTQFPPHFELGSLGFHKIQFKKRVSITGTNYLSVDNCTFSDDFEFSINYQNSSTQAYVSSMGNSGIIIYENTFKRNVSIIPFYPLNDDTPYYLLITDNVFEFEDPKLEDEPGLIFPSNGAAFQLLNNSFRGPHTYNIKIADFDIVSVLNNTFQISELEFKIDALKNPLQLDFEDNLFETPTFFRLTDYNKNHTISWSQFKQGIFNLEGFQKVRNAQSDQDRTQPSLDFETYREGLYYKNEKAFNEEIKLRSDFYSYFKSRFDTKNANSVYVDMKKLETLRLGYEHSQLPTFENFFKWRINQFLEIFSAYGTKPEKAVAFSLQVVLVFALIYLFFPNHWDSHGKNRIMNRYRFFLKYLNKEEGMHEVYLEDQKQELLTSEDFKSYLLEQGKTAPKFFMATALPLYRWSVASTKTFSWFLEKIDFLKGKWSDAESSKQGGKSFLLITAFLIALTYDIFIKMLNALMLSINTFTTLGFGEIPIKGLPRYLAIIQGFIGWFMLTIFSVSLISQLLN
jgi:ion channel